MSRIGKKPVAVPGGVKVAVGENSISVEGKAKLSIAIPPKVAVEVQDSRVTVNRLDDTRESGAMQGLARSLINNMVIGVTKGFKKELLIVGVGYRAQLKGRILNLSLGYSHPIDYRIPEGLEIVVDGNKITISGADKQLVGEAAATIRRFRKPEPYKGKGIRYADEHIIMKEGKTVG
ncbi:MAG: 50S ribosomal protein L6 [Victivallales bacterium]|nr:50S ribosomal protein L6 [Victivallales bacterium]